MAEELQSLLDKIQTEGVKKAEAQAAQILADAQKKANDLVAEAQQKAETTRKDAQVAADALQQRAENAIRQSSRDILLDLQSELKRRMEQVLKCRAEAAFSADFLAELIQTIVTAFVQNPDRTAQLPLAALLAPAQLAEVEKRLMASLGASFQTQVALFPNREVGEGLKVGFHDSDVFFDFSDDAIVSMVAAYAGPRIGAILKQQ